VTCFWVSGFGFGISGAGFQISDFGFRVVSVEFQGSVSTNNLVSGSEFRNLGFGFQRWGVG